MMKKKYTIEIGESELRIIGKVLNIYSHISLGKIDYLKYIDSIHKAISSNLDNAQRFDETSEKLKHSIYPELYSDNLYSSYTIFNKNNVSDDARVAAHLCQTIRHQFWLEDNKGNRNSYTADAYDADICRLANMTEPLFKIRKI